MKICTCLVWNEPKFHKQSTMLNGFVRTIHGVYADDKIAMTEAKNRNILKTSLMGYWDTEAAIYHD